MNQVTVWVEREPGVVEQHVDPPFYRWLTDKWTGRGLMTPTGEWIKDEGYAQNVWELLKGYDGMTAHDVAHDIKPNDVLRDETGALRVLAGTLAEVADRVSRRQGRASSGRMRAVWLADVELANMTVRVRADE